MKRTKFFLAIMTVMLLLSGLVFSLPTYYQFGNLNYGSINVTSAWTKLVTTSGTHSFTTSSQGSVAEVHVNSRFSIGTLDGANGVRFQVRVDDLPAVYENQGSIRTSNTTEFLSIFAVFQNLSTGSHTVSLWGRAAPSGSATSVIVDPGGWGGKIIVKETAN